MQQFSFMNSHEEYADFNHENHSVFILVAGARRDDGLHERISDAGLEGAQRHAEGEGPPPQQAFELTPGGYF